MERYSALRQFADSWVLLAMTLFFIGVVLWAFRPGARRQQDEVADSIFRNETKPLPEDTPPPGHKEVK